MSIDIDTLSDPNEERRDYRRANGAPLVSDPNDPTKTLRYRRPSSYGKILDDSEALTEWKLWKVMDGVARSEALQAQVTACKDEDRISKKELREKALDRGMANERADLGTGLHAMTVRAEDPADVDFDPPEPFKSDLAAYMGELHRLGLESAYMEVPIISDDFRAAGTADRVYRLTKPLETPDGGILQPGALVLGDIKTGKKLDFGLPAYCVQMAVYATGQFYDVVNNVRIATPPIDQHWMLLVHLPVGKATCEALWLNINTGLHGAYLTFEVMAWRNRWKSGSEDGYNSYRAASPVDLVAEFGATDAVIEIDVMVDYCRARIAAIGQHPKARERLMLLWPDGLPTPKKGIKEPEQVVTLLNLLDGVEKEFSIPFVEPDPRPSPKRPLDQPKDLRNERMLVGE